MPERSNGSGCKPDGYAFAGSNPAPPTDRTCKAGCQAQLAQLVEHLHGKEGVVGSSPTLGSLVPARGVALTGALEGQMAALRDGAPRTCHLALVGTGVRRSCQAVEIALPHRASCAGMGG